MRTARRGVSGQIPLPVAGDGPGRLFGILHETGVFAWPACIVAQGWPVARAAERFQVARMTTPRWAVRYRELDPAGMADRSSRRTARRSRSCARPCICGGSSG
jgi:hypothetical protein